MKKIIITRCEVGDCPYAEFVPLSFRSKCTKLDRQWMTSHPPEIPEDCPLADVAEDWREVEKENKMLRMNLDRAISLAEKIVKEKEVS